MFAAADDTASVTSLDSILRYEAADGSIVLLDTIGLGDTEIDQDKVVANIRDVALSAPRGVDVLLFVMRNSRITDDAIARLIYVTEYLWGQECLLNLYIVVTFASKYAVRRDEAKIWIDRQVEINWRFKHIFNLVGCNPNRFLFIDNPDGNSEEPNAQQRQEASREAMIKLLALHPRDVVPPFNHKMMKHAQQVTSAQMRDVEVREEEVRALAQEEDVMQLKDSNPSDPGFKPISRTTKKRTTAALAELRAKRADAKARREAAEKVWRKALEDMKADPVFQEQAAKEAERATAKFTARYQAAPDPEPGNEGVVGPVAACKKMIRALGKSITRRFTPDLSGSTLPAPTCIAQSTLAPKQEEQEEEHQFDVSESVLDALLYNLGVALRVRGLQETFEGLAPAPSGTKVGAAISPLIFRRFLAEVGPHIKRHQAGSLWRRGDINCDGQMDLAEFCTLFAAAPRLSSK